MENHLQAYLTGEVADDYFSIYYHIGGTFSGETDIRLRGDGQYILWGTGSGGRNRREFTGEIDASRVRDLAQKMLDLQVWDTQSGTERFVDDPPAIIGVDAGGTISQAKLRISEIKLNPSFQEVQSDFLEMIKELSNGEITESGR